MVNLCVLCVKTAHTNVSAASAPTWNTVTRARRATWRRQSGVLSRIVPFTFTLSVSGKKSPEHLFSAPRTPRESLSLFVLDTAVQYALNVPLMYKLLPRMWLFPA
mmetsp:Transcript_13170/g.23599  ORF Transcript_13170/g.23599 Transcript_13170/m.23599 type:complete len:105 (-) Transcript_13170:3687-4001(-)